MLNWSGRSPFKCDNGKTIRMPLAIIIMILAWNDRDVSKQKEEIIRLIGRQTVLYTSPCLILPSSPSYGKTLEETVEEEFMRCKIRGWVRHYELMKITLDLYYRFSVLEFVCRELRGLTLRNHGFRNMLKNQSDNAFFFWPQYLLNREVADHMIELADAVFENFNIIKNSIRSTSWSGRQEFITAMHGWFN